ncbi:unnamed protein product [Effrenium voratum]|nr:unnamed protein product [Effrenium voratum]
MRVVHICSAMKTSVIRYMQDLASEDLEFEGMAANWNTIQIFIRTLCDGCSYTLTAVSLVIPVLGAGAAFQIHYVDSSWLDVLFSVLPFATVSAMPMLCLYIAADLTQQCEQAPQVANSMLVSEWDTPMAQDLLAFMSRCQIGFYVNDMRVSPAAVMKFTYVLVAIFFTIISWKSDEIFKGLSSRSNPEKAHESHLRGAMLVSVTGEEVRPEDFDDNERLPKESDPWPQLFPPANTSAQLRHDTEKAAAVAMQAGDFTGAINVYTEAMRSGGSNPQMLCTRSALLLKMKRPCAAIRDCTAALKINNHMVKAYRLRGMAHRSDDCFV